MANYAIAELKKYGRIYVNYTEVDEFVANCKNEGLTITGGAMDNFGQWFYM